MQLPGSMQRDFNDEKRQLWCPLHTDCPAKIPPIYSAWQRPTTICPSCRRKPN